MGFIHVFVLRNKKKRGVQPTSMYTMRAIYVLYLCVISTKRINKHFR